MFLGTIFHNLGPVYLIECLPYVAVLNLGITNATCYVLLLEISLSETVETALSKLFLAVKAG